MVPHRFNMLRSTLILVVSIISFGNTELPSYVKSCSRSDPKLSECIVKHANIALEKVIAKGDPEHKIPSFKPYPLGDLDLSNKNFDLQVLFKNGKSFSKTVILNDASFDFEGKMFMLNFYVDELLWLVDFDIKGPLNNKEIHEVGKFNITINGFQYNYIANFDYEEIKGAKHFKVTSSKLATSSDSFDFVPYDQQSKGTPLDGELKEKFEEKLGGIKMLVRQKIKEIGGGLLDVAMNEVFKQATVDEVFLP